MFWLTLADGTFTLSDNIEGLNDVSARRNQEQVYDRK